MKVLSITASQQLRGIFWHLRLPYLNREVLCRIQKRLKRVLSGRIYCKGFRWTEVGIQPGIKLFHVAELKSSCLVPRLTIKAHLCNALQKGALP